MNHLEYRPEFEKILKNYKLSAEAESLLAKLSLVLLAGPSAAGRNTIIERLITGGDYRYIVSDTTRKPRVNDGVKEKNGINYWFREERELLEDLKRGAFLEAEVIHEQQVSGISMRELEKAYESNKTAITEVEIGGFINILNLKPDTFGIFVLPPSFDIWLERLKLRGEMPKEEVRSRLKTGVRIFNEALARKDATIVVNVRIEDTVDEIDTVVKKQSKLDKAYGLKTAAKLLSDTESFLTEL